MFHYKKIIFGLLLICSDFLYAADTTRELRLCAGFFKASESTPSEYFASLRRDRMLAVWAVEKDAIYIENSKLIAESCRELSADNLKRILDSIPRLAGHHELALQVYRDFKNPSCCYANLIEWFQIRDALKYLSGLREKTESQKIFEDFLKEEKDRLSEVSATGIISSPYPIKVDFSCS